jgi:hypothetical protein
MGEVIPRDDDDDDRGSTRKCECEQNWQFTDFVTA